MEDDGQKMIRCEWTKNGEPCYWADSGYCQNPTVYHVKDCKDAGYAEYKPLK